MQVPANLTGKVVTGQTFSSGRREERDLSTDMRKRQTAALRLSSCTGGSVSRDLTKTALSFRLINFDRTRSPISFREIVFLGREN